MTHRDPLVTSRIMATIKNSSTKPELALRRELHRRGLRFRVKTNIYGKPDLAFMSARVACFVDGDRWHGNGWRIRGFSSFEEEFQHSNSKFWKDKITQNMLRDKTVTARLENDGWTVIRVWASTIERDLLRVADNIENTVRNSECTAVESAE